MEQKLTRKGILTLFEYLTPEEILVLLSTNHGIRDEHFLGVCQVRVERGSLLRLLRKADRWKELLGRMKDPSKQLVVNQSKKVIQTIDKRLDFFSKVEFLKKLKEFPAYSIIPERLRFPSLHSLTIEYEFFLFLCEESARLYNKFTVESLNLFAFASRCKKVRKDVARWIEPYLPLGTKQLSLKDWPLANEERKKSALFPKLSPSLEVLSFHRCGSFRLHDVPNLRKLVLQDTRITNLKDLTQVTLLELKHQKYMDARDIPKVKKLVLKKCIGMRRLTAIQGIEEIVVLNCNIRNYCNLFEDVKRLSIRVTEINDDEYSDSESEGNEYSDEEEDSSVGEDQSYNDDDSVEDDGEDKSGENEDVEASEEVMWNDVDEEFDDDDYASLQEEIMIDLSQYLQLKSAAIFCDNFINGSLFSDELPRTLRTLKLVSCPIPVDLYSFSTLDTLELCFCDTVESLQGLGNIRKLKLSVLGSLRSLDGLGGNLNGCNSVNRGNQMGKINHSSDTPPKFIEVEDTFANKHIRSQTSFTGCTCSKSTSALWLLRRWKNRWKGSIIIT